MAYYAVLLAGLVTLAAAKSYLNEDRGASKTDIALALEQLKNMEHALDVNERFWEQTRKNKKFGELVSGYVLCEAFAALNCTEESMKAVGKCIFDELSKNNPHMQPGYDETIMEPWKKKLRSLRQALEHPDSHKEQVAQVIQLLDTNTETGRSFKNDFETVMSDTKGDGEVEYLEALDRCKDKVIPDAEG